MDRSTFGFDAARTLASVDAELLRTDRWLPADGPAEAEVGRLVALDATGPLRAGLGGWGQWVVKGAKYIGDRPATSFGPGCVGGGEVMDRLLCRTLRRPGAALAVRVHPETVMARVPLVSWAALTRSALWLGYLGSEAEMVRASTEFEGMKNITAMRHTLLDDVAMRRRLWRLEAGRGSVLARLTMPAAALPFVVLQAKLIEWVAEPVTAVMLAAVRPDRWDEVTRVVTAHGGGIQPWRIEHCATESRSTER